MQKPLALRRNFSWTFIGNVVYAACQWGMLVVLAKLGSPEMVGQFTLGLAVTAPVLMFTNLQLRVIQATDAKQQYAFGDYLGLRLNSIALALLLVVGITTAGYRSETSVVILVVGVAKALESVSDIFYGLLQQHELMDRIAVSMMIKGPLSLLFLGIGVYLTGSVVWGVVGLAVAWALVLFGYDIRSGARVLNTLSVNPGARQPGSRWRLELGLVRLSLPLGFVMMLISLNTNIPRYFIERHLGERELGVFAAIAYLMIAGGMVVNALGESASPRLAKYYAAGQGAAFRTLLLKLLGIGVLLGGAGTLVALVAGQEILTLVYQPEYAEHANLFACLMVAAGIGYVSSFLGYGMTAARYFRIQMPICALVTSTASVACFWLIPLMGLLGAAIALMIAAIVQASISSAVIFQALQQMERRK